MGRIGKLPIQIPSEVKVKFEQHKVGVEGPRGVIEQSVSSQVDILVGEGEIKVVPKKESKIHDSLRGTMRALINNMVIGVTQGYEKSLVIEGKGYRASLEGKILNLQVGHANPIKFEPPEGIEIEVPATQHIVIKGIDKQLVSNTAAVIRAFKPPEPYKGKGIRYEGESVRRKAGKKAGYGATGA